jgi:hypothetical protein
MRVSWNEGCDRYEYPLTEDEAGIVVEALNLLIREATSGGMNPASESIEYSGQEIVAPAISLLNSLAGAMQRVAAVQEPTK